MSLTALITQVDVGLDLSNSPRVGPASAHSPNLASASDYRRRLDKSLRESNRDQSMTDDPAAAAVAATAPQDRNQPETPKSFKRDTAADSTGAPAPNGTFHTVNENEPSATENVGVGMTDTGHRSAGEAGIDEFRQNFEVHSNALDPPAGLRRLLSETAISKQAHGTELSQSSDDVEPVQPPDGLLATMQLAMPSGGGIAADVFVIDASAEHAVPTAAGSPLNLQNVANEASDGASQLVVAEEASGGISSRNVFAESAVTFANESNELAQNSSQGSLSVISSGLQPDAGESSDSSKTAARSASAARNAAPSRSAAGSAETEEGLLPPTPTPVAGESANPPANLPTPGRGAGARPAIELVNTGPTLLSPAADGAVELQPSSQETDAPHGLQNSIMPIATETISGDESGGTQSQLRSVTAVQANRDEFVDRVSSAVRHSYQNNRVLRIRLHPPELGALQIEVVQRDGLVSVRLEAQTAVAHRAIVDNLASLRDALVHNGATVDRIDVQISPVLNDESPADFAQHHQQGANAGQQFDERGRRQQRDSEQKESDAKDTTGAFFADKLDIQV